MLEKAFICQSNLLYAAPVLFVKKPEKDFRFCVDNFALNAWTSKNENTFLLIQETFARFFSGKIYRKIDYIAALNEIRIREEARIKQHFIQSMTCMNRLWGSFVDVMIQEHFNLISKKRFGNSWTIYLQYISMIYCFIVKAYLLIQSMLSKYYQS